MVDKGPGERDTLRKPPIAVNLGPRLCFLLVAIVLPAFAFLALYAFRTLDARHADQIEEVIRIMSLRLDYRLATPPSLAGMDDVEREKLSQDLKRMTEEISGVDAIAVFHPDADGTLKFLAGNSSPARPTQEDAEVQKQGHSSRTDILRGDLAFKSVSLPIHGEGSVRGVVRLFLQPEKIGLGNIQRLRVGLMLGALVMLILVVICVLVFFRFAIRRPIHRLIDAMDRATGGDLSALVDLHAAEFGLLAGSYNQMMRRLKSSMDENRRLIEQIRRFNEELQGKVEAATGEVAGKNGQLQAANERLILLQRQLTTLEKLATLGQISTLIAHELGTPLNAISGHLQLLLQDPVSDSRVHERLKVIDGQVDRLTGIVRDVLKVMRVPPPRYERIDVRRVIQDVAELFGPLAEKRKIFLNLKLEDDVPEIGADPGQLQQVFLNLITNAVDAMKGGGTLTISPSFVPEAGGSGSFVRVDLSDTGTGMGEETVRHAFEPFYTTKRAEENTGIGLGLGLSICRQILKNHKGEIAVRSEPGKGTTFSITLPVG